LSGATTPPQAWLSQVISHVVDIFVGPKKEHCVVNTQLLDSQSEYFDGALNGGFREAQENSIYWEEDDLETVALMVGFLYRGVNSVF
jgi:hypothetical protein